MASMLPDRTSGKPLRIPEIKGEAVFRKPEDDEREDRRAHGAVLEHALKVARITPKEVAAVLNLEESNVYQWISGAANAPIGRLCKRIPGFEFAYIQTMAAQSEHLEVALTIRERRRA